MLNRHAFEFDEETGAFQTNLETGWYFWTYPNDNLTVFPFEHGPKQACWRCKLAPNGHGPENELCKACDAADTAEHEKDMETRRVQLAKAQKHLRNAARALKKMALASSSTERERLTGDADYCSGISGTLDMWRHDYRGGHVPRGHFNGDY